MLSTILLSKRCLSFVVFLSISSVAISTNVTASHSYHQNRYVESTRRKLTSTGGWLQGLLPNASKVDLVGSACSASVCMLVGIQVTI